MNYTVFDRNFTDSFALSRGLLLLDPHAPDKEGDIGGNGKQSAHDAEVGLNQYVVDSVVNDGGGKEAKGTNGEQLAFLFHKRNTHAYEKRAHAVHQTRAEGAKDGAEQAEMGRGKKCIGVLQYGKTNTGSHGCREQPLPLIGDHDGVIQNRQRFEQLFADGSNDHGDLIPIHGKQLGKQSVDLCGENRNKDADQHEQNRQARFLFYQHGHQQNGNSDRNKQNVDYTVHFFTPFFAASMVQIQRMPKMIAETARGTL